jgi:hypothetical protein
MPQPPSQLGRLAPGVEQRLIDGAREAGRFFVGESDVHRTLERLVDRLSSLEIPYAIIGALALNAYGYQRATVDVKVLARREGLEAFKREFLGRGYAETFPGSRGVRDTAHNVRIDVVLTGDYPGDGKEKPIAFPDPAEAAVRGERFALLPLERLIELKVASGMTAPHRLRDLADVIELIRVNELTEGWAQDLHPYVREKYLELWRAAQGGDEE